MRKKSDTDKNRTEGSKVERVDGRARLEESERADERAAELEGERSEEDEHEHRQRGDDPRVGVERRPERVEDEG